MNALVALKKANKYTDLATLGLSSVIVDDINKSITFTLSANGSQHTIHFDQPTNGASIVSVDIDDDNYLICTLSDGTVTKSTNPIEITATSGEENKIESVSVNGTEVMPDANKNINIEIPTVSQTEGNQLEQKEDGFFVKEMTTKISAEEGNAIVKKDDGLYVATPEEIKISEKENNQLTEEIDGLYVPSIDLTDYTKTEDVETLIDEAHYTTSVVSAHYEITDSTTENALEVVADGTATDGQIDISSVTPLLDGVTVVEGDYVVWVDETETKEAKFLVDADLEPYVEHTDITVIDSATIESMIGLNSDEILGLASLLSDQTIELSKTWSSSKIYSELANTLNESKAYTLSELSKAVGASYKVVTSIDQMTNSKVLYLLKDSDNGMYNIYVYDENATSAELIGSFEINLDDYYTKTECDERYVLATAFELLNNSIGNVNNLQTTSKVIVDAINEVKVSLDETKETVTENTNAIGDITTLETTTKDNVVNAVNEVKKSIDEFETYVELTQAEYDALADDETGKLNGTEYRTTDTGRIYKNGMQYGGQEPIPCTFEQYKQWKTEGAIDLDAEYIVFADENGILLEASDIGYSNAVSNLPCTTVQGAIDKVNDKVDNLIDDEVSDSTVWSSKKTSDEIAKKESVYITDSIANTLYYACEYFGLDCRNQYQVLEIEVIDAKGQNLKFNSIYKHEVLHHAQVISENGITLKAIDNIGTLAFENASDYTIKVKHIDICPDSIGDTLVTVINRANKNALASDIVGTKIQYRGSRSIDISTGGKLTLIYSSEYASQAGCYMLLSNYNTTPLLIELGKFPQSSFNVTATNKSFGVDTITVTVASDEYSWYVLQF